MASEKFSECAQDSLRSSMEFIREKETEKLAELASLAKEARDLRSKPKLLRSTIIKSRKVRSSLKELMTKRELLQNQLEIIDNSEFHKKLLTTLQTSATVMKEMGLSKDVEKADGVIADIEENVQSAQELTSAVSMGQGGLMDITDEELQLELDNLLGDEAELMDDDTQNLPPATLSSMVHQKLEVGANSNEAPTETSQEEGSKPLEA